MKQVMKFFLALLIGAFFPLTGNAAVFGWSGSGAGPGTGAGTIWLQANNWTNNSGLPGSADFAWFGAGGSATSIGINFNAPPAVGSTNLGVIVLGAGSTVDRTIGNSASTAGIATRLYLTGIGGGLITNAVSGRTLTLAPYAGGSLVAMTNVLVNSGVIEAVGNVTISANIIEAGGARSINKRGAGLLLLTGTNAYSGGTIINGGIVSLGTGGTGANTASSNSLGSGGVTINTNGQLRLWIQNSTTFPIPNNLVMQSGTFHVEDGAYIIPGTVTLNAQGGTFSSKWTGKSARFDGVISGAGVATIARANGVGDSGDVTIFNGANTFTGGILISAGALQLGTNGPTGTLGLGPITNNSSLILNRSDVYAVTNVISGTGSLTKNGASNSVVSLSSPANSFSGAVTVNQGGINVKNSSSLGSGTKNVSLANGSAGMTHMILDTNGTVGAAADINLAAGISFITSYNLGTVTNTSGNNIIQGNFTMSSGGGDTVIIANGGTLTTRGTFAPNTSSRNLRLGGTSTGTNTVAGPITGSGGNAVGLVKQDSGTWTLTGTNTFTGTSAINAGTLNLGANGSLSNSPIITVAAGAIFNVNGVAGGFALETNQTLNGAGIILGNVTLKSGATNAGTQVFVNSLTANSGSKIHPAGQFVPGTMVVSNTLTLIGGSSLNFDLGTSPLVNSGSNDLIVINGQLNISGPVPITFGFPLGSPALGVPYTLVRYSGSLTGGANLSVAGLSPGVVATLDTSVPGYITVTFTAGSPNTIAWTGTNGFNWNLATTVNFTNTSGAAVTFGQLDNVVFNDNSTNQTVTLVGNNLYPSSVLVNSTSNYTFNGSGSIAGGSITKTGNGTFTLGTANTTPGAVTVSGGTLKVGNAAALGTSSGITVNGTGQVDLNGVNQGGRIYNYTISGSGPDGLGAIKNTVAQITTGSGVKNLTLAGDATIGSTLAGNGSRLDIVYSGGLLNGAGNKLTKVGVGQLDVRGTTINLAEFIINDGLVYGEDVDHNFGSKLTINPAGSAGVYNNRVQSAVVELNGGTLSGVGPSGAATGIYTGPVTLNTPTNKVDTAGAYGGANVTLNGPVGGAGGLIKIGVNTLTMNGTNTYSGGTTISNGAIQGTTYSLQGNITNYSGLILNQAFDGTLSAAVTGPGGVLKRGLGKVTVTTPWSLTGVVTNEAGTIALGADNVLGFGLQDWRGASGLFPAFESADGSTRTITNSISISTDTRLGSAGSGNLVFSGPVNNGGAQKILTISNAVTTFSSGFGNSGTIVKAGPGQLTLGGASSSAGFAVSNGTMVLAAGGYFSNSPSMTIASGAVLDVSAGSGATFTNISGRTLVAGRTSGSGNDLVGNLQSTGTITFAAAAAPATFTVNGNVLIGGGALNFDLGSATTVGSGVSDLLTNNGTLTLSGPINLNLNAWQGALANGTYTLLQSAGALSSTATFTVTGTNGWRQNASVVVGANELTLTVAGTPLAGALTWLGTNATTGWDLLTTNWWSGSITDRFFHADSVLFDNSSTNTNVVVAVTVQPSAVTVNSASNYAFSGAGKISGGATFTKSGTGTNLMSLANDYTGLTYVNNGIYKLGNAAALGATNQPGLDAGTVINGGTVDLNGQSVITESFTVQGAGIDGKGAMVNNGGSIVNGGPRARVTLSGDATFGAPARWDLVGGATLVGNGYKFTKVGGSEMFLSGNGETALGDIDIQAGFITWGANSTAGYPGSNYNVAAGATLNFFGHTVPLNKVFTFQNGSAVTVGSGSATLAGPVTLNGFVNFNLGNPVTISNVITGPGLLAKNSANVLTIVSNATYSGGTLVNAGTLKLGDGFISASVPGLITNNNATIEFAPGGLYLLTNNIVGPGGTVRKSGTNLLQLAGSGGDQFADSMVLDVTGGTFDLNGRSESVRGLSGNLGAFVTNSSGSTVSLTLTNPNANPHTYNGAISGPITVVVRDSATRNGVLQAFTGTNTFTEGLVIDNGQLRASGDWVLGAVPGSFDADNIILRNNGTIQNNSSTLFIHPNRGIYLESDGTLMSGFSVGNDIVVNGIISGPGRLLKADGQRLILKNANTFTGDTVFTNISGAGTIRLDHTYALQNSTFDATGLGANGTLDLNNMDVVIGMLKGSGATIANFNGRLTVGGNGQYGTFGSTLSGAGNLVKVGSGVLALSAANPFNGGTIVSNGTLLSLGNLSGAGPLVVKSGATFGSPAIVSGPVTVEAGGAVYPGASLGTLSVSNHLAVTSGALFYELSAVNNIGGGVNDLINVQSNLTLSGSTLVRFSFVNGAPALGVPYVLMTYAGTLTGSAANLTSDTRYSATFDTSVAGQIRVTFSGTGGSNLVWTGSSTNNTWNLDTFTNWFNGVALDTFKDADSVTFDDTGYAGTSVILDGLLSPTALTVNAAQDYTFSGTGHINMAGRLYKLGAGKLTLANTNDFFGSVNVGGGTLSVGFEDALGLAPVAAVNQIFLPGGTFQVTGSFTLNSNRRIVVGPTNLTGSGAIEVTGTNVLTYGGIIGNNPFGVGTLVKRGTGRLSLSGANTYAGGTTISKGTVSIRNNNSLGTLGAITLGDAGSGADDVTLLLETSAGDLTLARDINVSSLGSGVITVGSTPLPLTAGGNNLRLSGNIALTNRDLALRSGAGNATLFGGDILGTGNLIITNGSLTGDMRGNAGNRIIFDSLPKSFTGDITILGGTVTPIYTNFTVLQLNAPHILPDTVNVTVQANAVFRPNADENINGLSGSGRVRGVVAARTLGVGANNGSSTFNGVMENDPFDAGSLAVTKLGSGTLTLNGTNTYTGATIVGGSGILALGANGSISNSTSLIISNGATFDVSAVSGGYVLMGSQALNGFGTVLGNVTVASNANVNPGLLNVVGTLAVTGNLGLNNSNRLNFDLGSVPAGPGNDQIVVTGDLNISGRTYIIVNAAGPLATGTYTLVTCSGTKTSLGSAANFILINNTGSAMTLGETANSITLTVTSAARSLVWSANFTNSLWDINNTTNWFTGTILDKFLAGDAVSFNSSASNAAVTLNTTVLPSTVSLTGATNYTFTGSGKISGSASIAQNSTSTNTMSLANDFSGSVTINGGVLKAGNAAALGNSVGGTIVNGGSLDVNALNLGAEQFVVQGTGWQGQGAIVNSGGGQNNATRFVTLAGDTSFGGTGRWDIRANPTAFLSSGGQPYKLTKVNANQVTLVDAVVDPALGDIEILGGILGFEVNSTAGDPSRNVFIGSGATLHFWNLNLPFNKPIYMTNGARFNNGSGVSAIISPITLLGSNAFDVAGTSVTLSNTVSGPGTLWKVGGGSTLFLAGNNTYSGGTVLQAGTTVIVGTQANSGGYSNAATIQIGNSGVSGGSLGGAVTNAGTINYFNGSITASITNSGTLNLQRVDTASLNFNMVGGGTINHASGSGPVNFSGGISNGSLRALSGNGSAISLGAGNYAFNGIAVGPTPSGWLNVQPGASVFANTFFLGEQNTQTGFVFQAGGDVWVTNQFRLAHWPNNVSTYLMGGGSLNMITVSGVSPAGGTEQNGGFYVGIDGVGIFTQTGGVVNVPGLVMDNRGATTLGTATNTYDLRGGTLNIGTWGILSPVTTYQINLGGGTVGSSTSWSSGLNMRLTGDRGDVTFNPGAFTNFLTGALSGPGGLQKSGAGALVLSGINTFAGVTLVADGTLVQNGTLANSPVTVSGGTLAGLGFLNRPVTVQAAGTIAPGVSSIGTLTITSNVTFAGTAVMDILKAGITLSGDKITGVATQTYGGTLTVVATGNPLAAGDTFDLFDASVFTGAFTSTNLPSLGAGLLWDLSKLNVDGTISVAEVPSITTQPASQVAECHTNVTFTVVAAGTGPFTYQWTYGGSPIANATNDTLILNLVTLAQSGNYAVSVTNAVGGTNSAVATLTVQDTTPPAITCPVGLTVDSDVEVPAPNPGSLVVADSCDGSPTVIHLSDVSSGYTPKTITRTYKATDGSGNFATCVQTITVRFSRPAPASYEPFAGYTNGSLVGQGYGGTGYAAAGSWSLGTGDVTVSTNGGLGFTNASLALFVNGGKATTPAASNNTVFAILDTTDAGAFGSRGLVEAGSGLIGGGNISGTLYYSFLARNGSSDVPNGTSDFGGLELYNGATEVFGVGNNWTAWAYSTFGLGGDGDLVRPSDSGTLNMDNSTRLFVVKVQFNAASDDTVTVWMDPDLSAGELGQPNTIYQRTVTGNATFDRLALRSGSDNNDNSWDFDEIRFGTNWVDVTPTVAGISVQPLSVVAQCGTNVSFSVTAIGTTPVGYQWFYNAGTITNATNATLTLSNALPANQGNYSVKVSNPFGVTTSQVATLSFADTTAPVINNPTNIFAFATNLSGVAVTLNVTASDNCTTNITMAYSPASGSVFPLGTNTVTVTATDEDGNSATNTFTVTVLFCQSTSLAVNLDVPDNNFAGLASTRTVSSPIGFLTDVNVTLTLSNGWNGDLYAYLVHDSGYSVLLNRVGVRSGDTAGYGDPGLNVTLDDQAANGDIHVYRMTLFGNHNMPVGGPLSGSWAPDGRTNDPALVLDTDTPTALLSSFNGLNPNGEWVLYLLDSEVGDTSTLVSWGLELYGPLGVAPAITAQPQPSTVECSSNATFAVTATGTGPIEYHWRFNGASIASPLTATLTVSNAHPANVGNYSVVVSNAFGSITSSVAALTVVDTTGPIVGVSNITRYLVGNSVSIAATDVFNASTSSDVCSGTVTLVDATPLSFNCAGSFSVTVRAHDGNGNTNTALATVTIVDPAATNLLSFEPFRCYTDGSLGGQSHTGTGFAAGSWSLDAGNAFATNAASLAYSSGAHVLATEGGRAYTPAAGFNTVRANMDTNPAGPFAAYLDGGRIGGPNASGTLYLSFLARNASGSLAGDADFAGLQLLDDGTEVLGIGNNWGAWAYSLFGISGDVDLTNSSGGFLSMDAGTHLFVVRIDYVSGADDTVTVWMDPDIAVGEGSQGNLYRRTFTGNARFNRLALRSGSDNNDNSWDFDEVRLGTAWASVTPAGVAITAQPVAQTAGCGAGATFTVTATGLVPPEYQWRKNGSAIAGATNASLTLTGLTTNDVAAYSVIVSNRFGQVTSANAALILTNTPLLISPAGPLLGGAENNECGSVVLAGGSAYRWELTNAAGTAGSGWDVLNVTGGLDVQATSGNPFLIHLWSLDGAAAGLAANWNNDTTNVFTIATVTDAVTNFTADKFTLSDANFANDLAGGVFSVEASPLAVKFTPNHAPIATSFTNTRAAGLTWKIRISDLLANATSDADGDARALTALGTSTNGVTITTNATHILYSGTGGLDDEFTYTIRDVRSYRGGDTVRTATGTIRLAIPSAGGTNFNAVAISYTNSVVGMRFAGIPGYTYDVQRATNLTPPVTWTTLHTTNCPPGGLFDYIDLTPPMPAAYYRTAQP